MAAPRLYASEIFDRVDECTTQQEAFAQFAEETGRTPSQIESTYRRAWSVRLVLMGFMCVPVFIGAGALGWLPGGIGAGLGLAVVSLVGYGLLAVLSVLWGLVPSRWRTTSATNAG